MIGLYLVLALFGFGAGYETHKSNNDVGCDIVVRDMIKDAADRGYTPIDGKQFSNGFVIVFANQDRTKIEQNIFSNEAPPASEADNWTATDQCSTAQDLNLVRYVRLDTMTNEPTSDARGPI